MLLSAAPDVTDRLTSAERSCSFPWRKMKDVMRYFPCRRPVTLNRSSAPDHDFPFSKRKLCCAPPYSILRPGTEGYFIGLMSSVPPGMETLRVALSPTPITAGSILVSRTAALTDPAPSSRSNARIILPEFFKLPVLIPTTLLSAHLALLKTPQYIHHLLPVHRTGTTLTV